MPSKTAKAKKLSPQEKARFVTLYVQAGADPKKLPVCEKRLHWKPGTGKRVLRSRAIQDEIKAKMEPVLQERMRQSVLGDSTKLAEQIMQEKLSARVGEIIESKITREVLDRELMRLVVGLDPQLFPREKREAIETAYVVLGEIESKSTKRTITIDAAQPEDKPAGIYTSLFNRPQSALTAKPDDQVYDLVPSLESSPPVIEGELPKAGESIDEPAPTPKNSRVITVEVE